MDGLVVSLRSFKAEAPNVIRILIRIIGLASLAGAFAASVIDGARSIADSHLSYTPMGVTAYWALPNKFPLLQPFIERQISPLLWDPVLLNILKLPTWLVLGLFGAWLLYVTRKRPPPIGHSNRSR
jgi:hypothetical protein